jgi:hypothetical protein
MRRPQFSLRWLLGLTALVALACTALINASDTWAMLLHSSLLASLLVAVLRAAYRRGAVRAFWVGFALFGWVYLILVYWVHYNSQFTDDFNDPSGSELATTRLLQLSYDHLLPLVRTRPAPKSGVTSVSYPDQQAYIRVGQPLCGLVVALIGGWIARTLCPLPSGDRQSEGGPIVAIREGRTMK